MQKRVLILGVGSAQVDAILRCKERGHKVFGLSYRNEGQGLEYVDHFEVINIVDKEEVLEYARKNGMDLVYSIGSDIAMPTIGFVSKRLGTPFFVSEETAELLQNKGRLRDFLKVQNLSPVPFRVAGSPEELAEWKVFPAIVKPVDSQGQRGVTEVQDASELPEVFARSLSFSRSEKVIVEQFIDGPEISVNAFVRNGEVVYSFITDRYVVENLPGGIVKGHGIPAQIDDAVRVKVELLTRKVITALGIENGPVYFQMKYTRDGDVFIIEVTPRLDGCHIWRLIELKYGVDLLELSFQLLESDLQMSLPHVGQLKSLRQENMRLDFFLEKPNSRFRKKEGVKEGELYKEWYYNDGQIVRPVNGYMEKTGYGIRVQSVCHKS